MAKVWKEREDDAPPPLTLRALSFASGVPATTLFRYLKRKLVRRFRSRVKPELNYLHKRKHLAFALSHVTLGTVMYEFTPITRIILL